MRGGFLCARNRCGLGCILVHLVGVEGALTEARIQLSSLRHQDTFPGVCVFCVEREQKSQHVSPCHKASQEDH